MPGLQQLQILKHGDEWASIVIDRARKALHDVVGERLRFRHLPGCGIEGRQLRSRQGATGQYVQPPPTVTPCEENSLLPSPA